MSTVDDLVTWLRAALDEEAHVATEAADGAPSWSSAEAHRVSARSVSDDRHRPVVYDEGSPTEEQADHIARWDPARVLSEVEAKRARIDLFAEMATGDTVLRSFGASEADPAFMEYLLKLEAQPYASRPGFRDEWRLT
jgi:hypothetical protein